MKWFDKFKVQVRSFFVNIKTTLAGIAALVLALSSQLSVLPESWHEPMRVAAVVATAMIGVFARDDMKTSEQSLTIEK